VYCSVKGRREELLKLKKAYNKTEDDLKALQSVGQTIGEVLKQLDEDRFIVKASNGPRYVVGYRKKVLLSDVRLCALRPLFFLSRCWQIDKSTLKSGVRVTLDMMTNTIMRALPREVDPQVFSMLNEDPGKVSFSSVGGLSEQIRELREVIELPLTNPELFKRVGIKPPKVWRY
jgi:26S proteasome regulatory subunit T4